MSAAAHAVEVGLLAAGTLVIVLANLGVVSGRTAYDKLHFSGVVAMLGLPLIAIAIVIAHGIDTAGVMAMLVAVTVMVLSPVSTHFIARAIRIREFGRWVIMPGEREERQ